MIALTTDFGTRDWFVGTMKGVIGRLAPKTVVVDLTHEIPPADIRSGAFALLVSYRYFPKGTIHLVVVDPGVGTSRKALAVQTQNYIFVGPDNGVLSWALAREKITALHAIENPRYCLKPISRTFHGRDVFAPGAAHLSRGISPRALGPRLKNYVRLDWPRPRFGTKGVRGEVIYVDRFGNAITNIDEASLNSWHGGRASVFLGRKELCVVETSYGSVPLGRPVAVFGSSGFLEIAVNGNSASKALDLRVGTPINLQLASNPGKFRRPDLRLVRLRRRK